MTRIFFAAMLLAGGLAATPVQAEVLRIAGAYPAGSDAAAAMSVIAVEPFGGSDGADLSIRIEDALRAAEIEGQPYFRILPGGIANGADGVLRGTATAEITRQRYTERRERCVSKDDAGKCIERRKEDIRCTRRTVEFVPNVRLIGRDGALVHADAEPETAQDSHCEDNSSQPRQIEAIVRGLSQNVAVRTRDALAPTWRDESIRVLEDRKGLSRDDGDRFKNALRLTKTDSGAACRQWQAIADANPSHAATTFNVGLCDEAAGDLDSAERLYRSAAQSAGLGAIADGLRRIEARPRATRQLDAHFGR